MGRPTREANDALGKLSPANPIFIYPVPGSHIIAYDFIFIYAFVYILCLYILDILYFICQNRICINKIYIIHTFDNFDNI